MEKYRTGLPRLIAALIDGFIIELSILPLTWFIHQNFNTLLNLVAGLALSLLPLSYTIYMHGRFGQTFGKYIAGVKITTLDGHRISYHQAIMRDIVPCIFLPVNIWVTVYISVLRELPPSMIYKWVFDFAFIWGMLELLTMFTNDRRRAIHDYIAKTEVIRVKKPF